MLKGSRKEYNIRKTRTLPLKNYTHIFLENKGSYPVLFGDYSIGASEKHTISTGNLMISENVKIDFGDSKTVSDNHLYISVAVAKNCN